MNGTGEDRERRRAADDEREHIRRAFPAEFNDGAKRGFRGDKLYPPGFLEWPLDRRNAWYAGFNKGYSDRKKREGLDGR